MSPRTAPAIRTEGLVDKDRQRQALTLIRDSLPKGITRTELARRLGDVSLRTVDRIITLLEAQGARMDRVRSGDPSLVHFRLQKGPAWDEHVSSDARLALRLASLSLSQSGTLLWQDKLETLEQLASDRMSSRDRKLFELLQRVVRVQGGVNDPIECTDILEPILKALEGNKEIEVDYQSAAAKAPATMTVVPYALTHDLFSGGAFLLVWHPERKVPLHLRLNRIGRVKVSTRAGNILHPELMERAARYQIGGWTSDMEPFQVKARIQGANWLQAFKEAPPALPDFESDPAPDHQSTVVCFWATHEYGARRWLLQFGAMAEVLAPNWLRESVWKQHEDAAAIYRA